MNVAGILFDLGGTLFSYRNVARTNIPLLIESAERMGADCNPHEIKSAYAAASRDVSHVYAEKPYYRHRDLFHDMFVRFCELIDASYDSQVHTWYHHTQQEAMLNCLEIKPDCIDTLRALRDRGLYLSIVSNIDDDMLDPLIEREGLHEYFDHWTSSEAAKSCKPHRPFFDLALEKAGLAPDRVLFVGDSPEHDIVGANRVGMTTVLIIDEGIDPPLQTGREAIAADHTIRALSELEGLV